MDPLTVPLCHRSSVNSWQHKSFQKVKAYLKYGISYSDALLNRKIMTVYVSVFSCDQAALWMVQSVRLSVCLFVTPFSLYSHHRIIMKFSGVITNDKSDVHAKGWGQRSKANVTEVKIPFSRFPVDCNYSLNRPVSQIRAPLGGLSRTSGKLWQDYSNSYMFWTQNAIYFNPCFI